MIYLFPYSDAPTNMLQRWGPSSLYQSIRERQVTRLTEGKYLVAGTFAGVFRDDKFYDEPHSF